MNPEAQRRYYWRGVYALREAETLTGLGSVSGPADAPPEKPEDQPGWVRDWAGRANEALKKALDPKTPVELGKSIGRRLREGVAAIKRAAPLEAAKNGLDRIREMAGSLETGLLGFEVVGTIVLVWLAYKFLK
jgi:hypothetical protein